MKGQIGLEMLIIFTLAITLVIWSTKLVDSLESGNVQEKMQAQTITQLVNSACSSKAKFTTQAQCSFETGVEKSYEIETQNNEITIRTGSKSASSQALCSVSGGPVAVNCENSKICLNPTNSRVEITGGECA